MRGRAALLVAVVLLVALPGAAQVELSWRGAVGDDLRVAVTGEGAPAVYRNDAFVSMGFSAELLPSRLELVADVRGVWTAMGTDYAFADLSTPARTAPYYLESDAAYVHILDALPGLDIYAGRQIVRWGAADLFNPTNNINPLDLEDPLDFGRTQGTQALRLEWASPTGAVSVSAVWVPVFAPALLPASARLYVGDVTSEFPFVDPDTRLEAEKLRNIYLRNEEAFIVETPDVRARSPRFRLRNSQLGIRVAWVMGGLDTSLSYYVGRDSAPLSVSSVSRQEPVVTDAGPAMRVLTDVELRYPRKQVLGFDLAGELPFLDGMGFWFEGAVTFPHPYTMTFDITAIVPSARVIKDYVVTDRPFFKCTAGADYSLNQYVFVTGQFIRGFPDEFGAHAIGNYWMAALDFKFLQDRLTVRNVVLGEIPHRDTDRTLDEDGDGKVESLARGATNDGRIASLVYYPALVAHVLDGLEVTLGAYLRWGHPESKFAMPAAGPAQVFAKAVASF